MRLLIPIAALLLACAGSAFAVQGGDHARDEEAIRKALDAYVAAYNRGDAKALAALMTANAEYIDDEGEVVRGRAAIEKEMADFFAEGASVRLAVTTESRRFIRPDVAIERGTAVVTSADGGSAQGGYTTVWSKVEGSWKMESVQESVDTVAPSHFEKLQELAWLVGTWVDQDDHATIRTVGEWTANRNFITRSFSVAVDGHVDLSGTEVIGWDPASERIRGWVFDSEGGFSQETWTKKGDRWVVTSAGVLSDGRRSSAVHIYQKMDDDRYSWQSTEREVDGEFQPDVRKVTVVRESAAKEPRRTSRAD
jgi:uncharacterized protein (TIGR02246 family)